VNRPLPITRRLQRWLWTSATVCLGVVAVGCPRATDTTPEIREPDWSQQRQTMVRDQIETRGVRDPEVLGAMRTVQRHLFVAEEARLDAYEDTSPPIGDGQTTPEPYIVALMTELADISKGARVLEVGTGSGYQTAVLASMGASVFSVEIRPSLCERAARLLGDLGYENAEVRCGDGYNGWPEEAPFDAIVVSAAPEQIPDPLLEQLAEGGHMVVPVGDFYQELKVIVRAEDGIRERSVIPVRFPAMDRSRAGGDRIGGEDG